MAPSRPSKFKDYLAIITLASSRTQIRARTCRVTSSRTHSLAHSTRSTSNFLMGNICVNSDPDAAADKVWKMQAERENLYNWLTSKVGTGNAPLRLEARLRVPLPLDSSTRLGTA